MEPINRYETHFLNRLNQAVKICEAVGIENVQIMADFFHMNIEEPDIVTSLEAAAQHIAHIHLADSNRLLPGFGHLDFSKLFTVLKEMNYTKYMALECRVPSNPADELPACVRYLQRCL